MQRISVIKHLEEMQKFVETSDNIRLLIKNFDNLNSTDKNDLYDLVYNKKRIEEWLKEDIADDTIKNCLEEMLYSINLLLDSLSEKQLQEITTNKVKNIQKLNKAKYGRAHEYKGLTDKTKFDTRQRSKFKEFMKKKIVSFAMVVMLMLLTESGFIIEMGNFVEEALIEIVVDSDTSVEENILAEENTFKDNIEEVVTTTELQGNTDTLGATQGFGRILSMVMSLLMLIIMIITVLRIMIDILYITMPIFRMMGDKMVSDKIVSDEAKEVVAYDSLYSGFDPAPVNVNDRFETATALLHNLSTYVKNRTDVAVSFKSKKKQRKIIGEISPLANLVSEINTGIKSDDILVKVGYLVDAEMLYRKYYTEENSVNEDSIKDNVKDNIEDNYKDKDLVEETT